MEKRALILAVVAEQLLLCYNQQEWWCKWGSVGWPGVLLFSARSGALTGRGNANESVLQFVTCSLGIIQHLHSPTDVSVHGASPDFHSCRNCQVAVCDEQLKNRDLFGPKWILHAFGGGAFLRSASAGAGLPGLAPSRSAAGASSGWSRSSAPISAATLGPWCPSRLARQSRGEERAVREHRALEITGVISGGWFMLAALSDLHTANKSVNQ